MQPTSLNAPKAWQTVPAGSLRKWEPSKKHRKNKLSLVAEFDERFYIETKKLEQLHSVMANFKT